MEGIKISTFNELSDLDAQYQRIAELGKNLNHRFLELYCLYQIAATLSEKMDLDATLNVAKKLFQRTFQIDHYSVFLVDEGSHELELKSWFGFRKLGQHKYAFGLDEGVFGIALQHRHSAYIRDIEAVPERYTFYPALAAKKGSFLCLPLISDTLDQPLGTINLYRKEIDGFTPQEIKLFEKLAQQIARVLDKVLLYHQTRELSITDELTKIFNRRYFNQRFDREFQRAQRYNRPLSIIMADIDHFKNFNDAHGHLVGDEVLKGVAKALEHSLRKADIVARFGGEEFVVLLPEIDKEHAKQAAEKLRKTIESLGFPGAHTQRLGSITISLGLAAYPEDAVSGEELLEVADKTLYLAKSLGRNRVGFLKSEDKSQQNGAANYRLAAAG